MQPWSELGGTFPEIDQAVQANLNAIAVAVNDWRKNQLRTLRESGDHPPQLALNLNNANLLAGSAANTGRGR